MRDREPAVTESELIVPIQQELDPKIRELTIRRCFLDRSRGNALFVGESGVGFEIAEHAILESRCHWHHDARSAGTQECLVLRIIWHLHVRAHLPRGAAAPKIRM